MDSNRGVFLIILLLFIFFTPAGNPPHLSTSDELGRLREYISMKRNETETLKNSTWLHPPSNVSGISPYPKQRKDAGGIYLNSFLPPEIIDVGLDIWNWEKSIKNPYSIDERAILDPIEQQIPDLSDSKRAFFTNISGVYEGLWHQEEKTKGILIPRNITIRDVFKPPKTSFENNNLITGSDDQFVDDPYKETKGNITAGSGRAMYTIHETAAPKKSNVTMITMAVALYDEQDSLDYSLDLHGFHFKPTGNLLMTTSSLKFSGLAYLPHLMLDDLYFDEARDLMYRFLNNTLNEYDDDLDFRIFEDAEKEADNCEYIVYGHVHSVPYTAEELEAMEKELVYPEGRPLHKMPPLMLKSLLYSPDCAVGITTEKILGEKFEQYWYKIRLAILGGVCLLLVQMFLFANQMEDTNTPSLILKINYFTIIMMAVMDGSIWMASFVSFFVESLTLPFMAMAFLSFVLTSVYELKYMVKIYKAQLVDSAAEARVRESLQSNTVNGQNTLYAMADGTIVGPQANSLSNTQSDSTSSNEGTLPLPVTTPSNNPPREEDQSERAIAGTLYSRFYFILLVFIITSLIATTWPFKYRVIYEYCVVFMFYSVWVPQIYRNITKGFRKSFLWSFMLGTSFLRLMPLYYVCLYRKNVVDHHYDPVLALSVTVWISVQLLVMGLQKIFGARFFLPRGYLPILYDYHPVLYHGDVESDLGIDIAQTMSEQTQPISDREPLLKRPVARPNVDCAICMNPVELVILSKENPGTSGESAALLLARQKYMVTPCQHVFHTECLERWMRTRLQCPICRNPLPPL